jgi:hypothetical protein
VYCSTDTLIPPSPSWLISTSNNNLNDALSFHGCFKTPVLPRRRVGLDVSKSVVTPNESLQSNSRVISLFFCFVGIRWALLQSPFVNGLPVQLGGHQDVHAGGIFLALLAEEKPVFYRRHKRRRETEVITSTRLTPKSSLVLVIALVLFLQLISITRGVRCKRGLHHWN